MKPRLNRIAGALFAVGLLGGASTGGASGVKAWIDVEVDADGHQRFVGYASSSESIEGRFELVGERRGSGGVSRVRQGGRVRTSHGEKVRLAEMSFGDVASEASYSVRLSVFQGDAVVGSAEIVK